LASEECTFHPSPSLRPRRVPTTDDDLKTSREKWQDAEAVWLEAQARDAELELLDLGESWDGRGVYTEGRRHQPTMSRNNADHDTAPSPT
jgi:hypothetical protein